jgi:hypothetical protein
MAAPPHRPTKVPPLRAGDHLDREEFERRYNAMPSVNKAELNEGVVYMPSPVSFEDHAEQHAHLMGLLAMYRFLTPGVRVGDNATFAWTWAMSRSPMHCCSSIPTAAAR